MANDRALKEAGGKLGTFGGVFTPSILTILGIILFLRLGYVVGSSGLMQTLVIIAVANLISVMTTFSLAAIATNLKVKGGGDYYLISRTIGLEFGGALGLVLFLAQSVSIAFYCIGFGEAVAQQFSGTPDYFVQLIAAFAVTLLFILAWVGADLATKFQYVVMTFLSLGLVSFYVGGVQNFDLTLIAQNWAKPEGTLPFWVLFALFFPAVTGFTQGVSMSGDLKDAGKSLPAGTFYAVGLSILVYFSVAVLFAGSRPLQFLSTDYRAMGDISEWAILVDAGVIAATLSSAIASFLGAPRILQSLAKDKIFPVLNVFAVGTGATENPRKGVLLSALIAYLTIALGQLDLIARLVSMFFLISYGLLNYATYFEAKAASPSFRPRFRWYHPNISLAGFLACLGVMLAIDLSYGVAAIAILFAIYQYLKRTARPVRWADSQRSHHLQRVRNDLVEAGSEPDHPRDWRPYILALSDNPERRQRLLQFAGWLEGGSGITTVVRFLRGHGVQMRKRRKEAAEELEKEIHSYRADVFSRVISGHDPAVSLETLIQSFGVGPVRANTILVNWIKDVGKEELHRLHSYGRYLRSANRMGCHIVVLCTTEIAWENLIKQPREERRIDVWWRGDAASRLMLLLAYLVTREHEWSDAHIRVLAVNYSSLSDETVAELQNTIDETRIKAQPVIIADADLPMVLKESGDASLTFLSFSLKNNEPVDMFGSQIKESIAELGVTAFVQAGQPVDLDAEPEEGEFALLAMALDAQENANHRMEQARKEAAETAEQVAMMMNEIEPGSGVFDGEMLQQLKAALKARDKADDAIRKALREEAKAQAAAKLVESYEKFPEA